jgi:hypothetical protein
MIGMSVALSLEGNRMIRKASEELLWGQIVAQAWCDESFMRRLQSDPQNVLAEYGLEVDKGTKIEVVEGTEVEVLEHSGSLLRLSMPSCPPELTDEDLVGGAVAQSFSAPCVACGACGRCACRCNCRCNCRCW